MSEPAASRWQDAGPYEIRLKGHLETRWAAWFDGLSLTHDRDGTTVLHGPIVDQAALHGLLQRVRDLGLPLVSVTQVDAATQVDAVTLETPRVDPEPMADRRHAALNSDSHGHRTALPDGRTTDQEGPPQ